MPILGAPVRGDPDAYNPYESGAPGSTWEFFKPPSRARSEASFSEFHYDNTDHPAAGVRSARLWEHKSKNCSNGLKLYKDQVHKIIKMTPEQEYNAQFERMDGPRLDPAKVAGMAGDMSSQTKNKVTLLGHHEDYNATAQKCTASARGINVKRARGFILDISRKSPAACAPPPRSTDPLRPQEQKFIRQLKRFGYITSGSNWTWNESHRTGENNDITQCEVLAGLSATNRKVWQSVKGERKYNLCGAQDMIPAATKPYTSADWSPSKRHMFENDKKYLQGFERGVRPKGVPQEMNTVQKYEYCGESPEMWNCMSGQQRPLDRYRLMSARGGQHNWMKSAESVYAGDDRPQYSARLNSARSPRSPQSPGAQSPGSESQFEQYQKDAPRNREMLYSRSLASSDAGSRVSRTSRASAPPKDLTQQRWT